MNPALSAFLSKRLIDRRGGHRARVLEAFDARRRLERSNRSLINDAVGESLARLLNHARSTVPRFRDVVSGAITAANARDLLARWPVMTKAAIQAAPASFTSAAHIAMRENSTGGSSGNPMVFMMDDDRQVSGEAAHLWANSIAGWRYGERIAMLWGADRDVRGAVGTWRKALRCRVENIRWYNAFDMGEARMERFHEELTRFRPHLVIAYSGSVFAFARFLEARGLVPEYPSGGIVSSAEMVTKEMRDVVERVFRRPVFDRYGSREFGPLASECEAHNGLHQNETDCVVEVDSPDPFRVPGRVLITYLHNLAMPFIRYDTGDLGLFLSFEPCSCGRQTMRMAPFVGRVCDLIRTRSGKMIHGEYFTHVLYGTNDVKEFQFVQEDLDRYRLLLVADRGKIGPLEELWRGKILEVLDPGSQVQIEYVDEIPALPSGKRRFTLSRIAAA